MDWTILIVPASALIRNVAGWLENSAKDGEIQKYEWTQLGSTVVKYVLIAGGLVLGFDMDVMQASTVPILMDYAGKILEKIKK